MSLKRLLLSVAGSSVLVGALLTSGAHTAGAQTAPDFNQNCANSGLNLSGGGDPNCNPAPGSPLAQLQPVVPAPVPAAPVVPVNPYAGYAQTLVNQDSFMNLVARQLGVDRNSLNVAFQQAEAVAAQSLLRPTQDQMLALVAGYLGVNPFNLTVAIQQSAFIEVGVLQQYGLISADQASIFDASIASGVYGLGLGFGIPGFSAPAI
jgi:hypothetical protein